VSVGPAGPILAVLDTSFWVAGYRAEVVANCLDLFDIVVPAAVEAEILAVQASAPQREYPYATLFRQLRHKFHKPPAMTPTPLGRFGPGEAEAIPLALELNAVLLVNERPAAAYAANIGVQIVTVPTVIVALRAQGIISRRAAETKLALIASITSPRIIEEAWHALTSL